MVDWQGTLGAENDVIVFFLLIYPRLVLEKPATWKHQWEQEQKPTVSAKDQQRTNLEDRILIDNNDFSQKPQNKMDPHPHLQRLSREPRLPR